MNIRVDNILINNKDIYNQRSKNMEISQVMKMMISDRLTIDLKIFSQIKSISNLLRRRR